jgi:hypothetical protein
MPAKKCYHFNNCMYQDQERLFCSPTKCGYYEEVKESLQSKLKTAKADMQVWKRTAQDKALEKELAAVKERYKYLQSKAREIVGTVDVYLKGGE